LHRRQTQHLEFCNMQITVLMRLKRNGELFGQPRITFPHQGR
jgi:hypothetical protein